MKSLLRRFTFAAVLLISPALLLAADPVKSTAPARENSAPAATASANDPWQRKIAAFEIDGLPMSEVANLLADSKYFPEINFLVDPAARDMAVPLLKLRSATLDDIFTALNVSLQGALQVNKINDRMVSFAYRTDPAEAGSKKPICRAFSLSRYLAGKTDKDVDIAMVGVESALNTCWEMLQRADRSTTKPAAPQLNLHRATKLLIVVGDPEQIGVVEQVIGQLEEGAIATPLIDPTTGLPAGGFSAPGAALPFGGSRPSTNGPYGTK